ncbi:nucleotidyltransferase domain-containing protein [Devosia sp. CN2-171]|uniref:nucleotidyltransferase domain-containing protein n=1 Tax=Devosia sp. CN2-171 TaxID=3400909 RepID=UPI003BF8EEBB
MIPESQLDTWAKQGSVTQSAETYQSIKAVIESANAPYSNRSISSFLQGSYGNDTNVRGVESDVDIVLKTSSIYYPDLQKLPDDQKAHYKRVHTDATYSQEEFRTDVSSWLQKQYGADFDPGEKALTINANGNRRSADVLACSNYRRYTRFNGHEDATFIEGICFKLPNGTLIPNFPKLHYDNCVKKHQDTNGYFKAMVRIWKNMRNRMKDDGLLEGISAPSYYIEGLLWNVTNDRFGKSYQDTFLKCFSFIHDADKTQLVCANYQAWLLRKGEATSWDTDQFTKFFNALGGYWDDWS